jgi:hypothetical protein
MANYCRAGIKSLRGTGIHYGTLYIYVLCALGRQKVTNTINEIYSMINIARVAAASVALECEGPVQSFFFCRLEG